MLSPTFLAVLLAAMPSVHAIAKDWWPEVDCYVGNVKVDNKFVDKNRSLKYDWQLTLQTCVNNFAPQVCIAINTNVGIDGKKWWDDCKRQALDGWYDVDGKTNMIVISHSAYKSDWAEGRGYGY
ncbi:hypothetical protein H9Q72_006291 [Fusarium xylarioides]|uniref:Uncharacterized protein n=1 Tax=Fusarium xylarioides TaxID=221167 RepID=A0A9P7HST7_9HYPO|nr:hypothetical protein H9Q72_006291 [Fusarium xylarioides]